MVNLVKFKCKVALCYASSRKKSHHQYDNPNSIWTRLAALLTKPNSSNLSQYLTSITQFKNTNIVLRNPAFEENWSSIVCSSPLHHIASNCIELHRIASPSYYPLVLYVLCSVFRIPYSMFSVSFLILAAVNWITPSMF